MMYFLVKIGSQRLDKIANFLKILFPFLELRVPEILYDLTEKIKEA